jgi:hypothetical protein
MATKKRAKPVQVGHDVFLQNLLAETFRNRLWITVVTLITFLLIIGGIGHSLVMGTLLAQEWKEILLLVLGAFIGSYNRVIDFWFNSSERDKELIARADNEDADNFKQSVDESLPVDDIIEEYNGKE